MRPIEESPRAPRSSARHGAGLTLPQDSEGTAARHSVSLSGRFLRAIVLSILVAAPSSCMFAEKGHDVWAVAKFVDGQTLGVLVDQEDVTRYEVVTADAQQHSVTEWLRGFLVRYDLGAAGGVDPVPASIELLYSRAPTEADGFSESRLGVDMSGVLLEQAAREGLDTSIRDLRDSRKSDDCNLERIWPRDVPEADANAMRAAGFPIGFVCYLARQGQSRTYLALDDRFGKCVGPRIFVADTGAMYASGVELKSAMIWDQKRSRLLWFDLGSCWLPTAVHIWRYVDGATDTYRLESPTKNRFLHFHE